MNLSDVKYFFVMLFLGLFFLFMGDEPVEDEYDYCYMEGVIRGD